MHKPELILAQHTDAIRLLKFCKDNLPVGASCTPINRVYVKDTNAW